MSYYSEHAQEYIESTLHADMSEMYAMFEPLLPKGGSILDVGFGSARDMLYFRSKGFDAHGIDPEPKFVEHAKILGLDVEAADVLSYAPNRKFDGIWACASLLHLTKREFHNAIDHLISLLSNKGFLFISMKEGNSEGLDEKGRPMLFVGEDTFDEYKVYSLKRTVEQGRGITWINAILKK